MMLFTRTQARAARGAQMLDLAVPGWHWKLDVDTLDIADSEFCVLGQLYGSYFVGMGRLNVGIDDDQDVAYGFYAKNPLIERLLTRAWKREIAARCTAEVEDVVDGASIHMMIEDEVGAFR